jgi:hypothetical protein
MIDRVGRLSGEHGLVPLASAHSFSADDMIRTVGRSAFKASALSASRKYGSFASDFRNGQFDRKRLRLHRNVGTIFRVHLPHDIAHVDFHRA